MRLAEFRPTRMNAYLANKDSRPEWHLNFAK